MLGPIFNREALTVPRHSRHYLIRSLYLALLLVTGVTFWQTLYGWGKTVTIGDVSHFGVLFFQQLRDPHPALRSVVVHERELWRVLDPQFGADPALQIAVCGVECLQCPAAFAGVAEHGHEHARMAEIRRCLDSGHCDKSDPRVLQL